MSATTNNPMVWDRRNDETYLLYAEGSDASAPVLLVRTGKMAPGLWVCDRFATEIDKALIAGPFATIEAANSDRLERSIAEDCEIVRNVGL